MNRARQIGPRLTVEVEHDGRWVPIGELTSLPAPVGYAEPREQAIAAVEEIALQMTADQLMESERKTPEPMRVATVPEDTSERDRPDGTI